MLEMPRSKVGESDAEWKEVVKIVLDAAEG